MTETVDVSQARELPGLRLVLTAGAPGPWGEAAKGLFHVKGVPYVRVAQAPGLPNEPLAAWTGRRNAPVAIHADEPARDRWDEILLLAERLAPEPPLLPRDPIDRAWVFGLGHEICGEQGFGWNRRLMMLHPLLSRLEGGEPAVGPLAVPIELGRRYGYSRETGETAPARVGAILSMLAARLRAQREQGSPYFVGDRLTAVDVWWAAFAALVAPLSEELCPMNRGMRAAYTLAPDALGDEIDPLLLEHRRRVYQRHLELPVVT